MTKLWIWRKCHSLQRYFYQNVGLITRLARWFVDVWSASMISREAISKLIWRAADIDLTLLSVLIAKQFNLINEMHDLSQIDLKKNCWFEFRMSNVFNLKCVDCLLVCVLILCFVAWLPCLFIYICCFGGLVLLFACVFCVHIFYSLKMIMIIQIMSFL